MCVMDAGWSHVLHDRSWQLLTLQRMKTSQLKDRMKS